VIRRDRRNYSHEAIPVVAAGLQPFGDVPDLDPFTGSIRRKVYSTADFEHLSPRLTAMELAKQASVEVSGLSAAAEFGLPHDVIETSAGVQVVHLQQLLRGIPLFQSGRTVALRRSGKATVSGGAVEALNESESEPRLDARAAVIAAARFLAAGGGEDAGDDQDLSQMQAGDPLALPESFEPVQTAAFDLPAQPTTFSAEPFEGPVKASLVYLYMGPNVRLAWEVELVYPYAAADYAVLVAAGEQEPGEILYAADRVCSLLGQCEIHPQNPDDGARATTPFPLPAGCLPLTLGSPPAPKDWIDGQPLTSGNNVECKTHGPPGHVSGDPGHGVVTFGPFSPESPEDRVAHAFYYCNVMHDFFESLGFDEQSGNFQRVNFSRAPGSADPVNAIVYPQGVPGLGYGAWMQTPVDGLSPTLSLGLFGSGRHTALDSEAVFHEFAHGVTNRLVGRRVSHDALSDPQSFGMGEGWSDFFALTFHNVSRSVDKEVICDWVANNPGGVRKLPYNADFAPRFDCVGKGRFRTEHDIGEIWCATLMMAIQDLAAALRDKPRAYAIAWQCVVDGLKLSDANPSFLAARDAISDAIDDLYETGPINQREHEATRQSFWKAFAHFRMGANAKSRNAGLDNIFGDDALPADVALAIEIATQEALVEQLRQQEHEAQRRWTDAKQSLLRAKAHNEPAESIQRHREAMRTAAEEHTVAQESLQQAEDWLKELQRNRDDIAP
jgi:extracellular elastinolytic metalloproteinase